MATPNEKIKGPGLLYVTSRIERTDLLDEATYFKWCMYIKRLQRDNGRFEIDEEDHIAEIVETTGMVSAFRYLDVDKDEKVQKKEKVYLAFYPMQDLAFTQSEEFRKIRVKSDLLPGSGIIYDLAEFDVRYLGLVHKTEEAEQKKTKRPSPCLAVFGLEPGTDQTDDEAETWLREEHIPAVASARGYYRSTLYRLQYARTNAQSRALKGLPTTDAPAPEPPTWLALHEFDEVVDFPVEGEATPKAKKLLGNAKQVERVVYRLEKALGDRSFF